MNVVACPRCIAAGFSTRCAHCTKAEVAELHARAPISDDGMTDEGGLEPTLFAPDGAGDEWRPAA